MNTTTNTFVLQYRVFKLNIMMVDMCVNIMRKQYKLTGNVAIVPDVMGAQREHAMQSHIQHY
jgi:hypothetical protein